MELAKKSSSVIAGKSSSLIERRRKNVASLTKVPTALPIHKTEDKSLQILEVLSPLVGAASRAIMKKFRKMGKKCALEASAIAFQEPIALDEHAGFIRLVYHKARETREKRFEHSLSLREVACDILHAVRISMRVRRFIAAAKPGKKSVKSPSEPSKILNAINEADKDCTDTKDLDEDWKCLMSDLTPMTPLTPWGKKQAYMAPPKQANVKAHLARTAEVEENKGPIAEGKEQNDEPMAVVKEEDETLTVTEKEDGDVIGA
jgi:hypothetical protein